jgi:hypothetical protein
MRERRGCEQLHDNVLNLGGSRGRLRLVLPAGRDSGRGDGALPRGYGRPGLYEQVFVGFGDPTVIVIASWSEHYALKYTAAASMATAQQVALARHTLEQLRYDVQDVAQAVETLRTEIGLQLQDQIRLMTRQELA